MGLALDAVEHDRDRRPSVVRQVHRDLRDTPVRQPQTQCFHARKAAATLAYGARDLASGPDIVGVEVDVERNQSLTGADDRCSRCGMGRRGTEVGGPVRVAEFVRQPFKLPTADIFEPSSSWPHAGFFVQVHRQCETLGQRLPDVARDADTFRHRGVAEWDEGHDIHCPDAWVFALVMSEVDCSDGPFGKQQRSGPDRKGWSGECEDRAMMRRVSGVVEEHQVVDSAQLGRELVEELLSASLADVGDAFDEAHASDPRCIIPWLLRHIFMSDPLRTDDPRPLEPAPDVAREEKVGREEKIEQLLLAGLEYYFRAEYDQAINVWTRALFFDRGHARARAYIDRARCAQAERQRESEELLQRGVAAFQHGDADQARRLLRDAIDQGAPPEEALAVLERINKLEQMTPPGESATAAASSLGPVLAIAYPRTSRTAWAALVALGVIIAAALAFAGGAFRADGVPALGRAFSAPPTPRFAANEQLPLPRRGENLLARARTLAQRGRLRDALAALDGIRPTDAQKPDADRLRADIQKQLLAVAGPPVPSSGPFIAP